MSVAHQCGLGSVFVCVLRVLSVSVPVDWVLSANGRGVFGQFSLSAADRVSIVFREATADESTTDHVSGHPIPVSSSSSSSVLPLLSSTHHWWLKWMSQCCYDGRWSAQVRRSALALKLLHFEPSGSCVAAPTTSLPETLGGVRNWDYRFAWIRDTSFIMTALIKLGFHQEVKGFMTWIKQRVSEMEGGVMGHGLQALYGIRGQKRLEELQLKHLRGYMHSRPVRIGNAAYDQIQLDIYGELFHCIWQAHICGAIRIDEDLWANAIRPCIDWICAHRQDKDEGVWEVRGGKQSFTYSRLMIWVALDRAIKLAEELIKQTGKTVEACPVSSIPDLMMNGQPHEQREYAAGHAKLDAPDREHSLATAYSAGGQPADSPLPPELCEGCTIPAPSPSSPAVKQQPWQPPDVDNSRLSPTVSSSSSSELIVPSLTMDDLNWWRSLHTELFTHLQQQAYNEKRQAFVQHVATPPHPSRCTVLDAACLAFPLYNFLSPSHPRVTNTVHAILSDITTGGLTQNNLVYRYNVSHTKDGLWGEEGTFGLCTFWSIEALAMMGKHDEAALNRGVLMMEQMIGLSNHLDLYSEELLLQQGKHLEPSPEQKEKGIMKEDETKTEHSSSEKQQGGPNTAIWDDYGDYILQPEVDQETRYLQIGNFPQGFTHLAFINAAITLNETLTEREEAVRRLEEEQTRTVKSEEQKKQQQQQHSI